MPMDINTIKLCDDQHAISALRADYDPLVNTAFESFLLDWVEGLLDARDDETADAIGEYGFTADDIRAMGDAVIQDVPNTVALLNALVAEGIDTPDALRALVTSVDELDATTNLC